MGGGRGGRAKGRKKHGKERLDRYYHLAKEQGYRARSAFKLIQLAQRFSLFHRPRIPGVVCTSANAAIVDLCAAPGGWLQVCVKHAPVATRILGVDLVPIKSIRGVDTLTEDITRPSLPAKIKKLLPGADVWLVLHDGSPNMGTDWNIDAFNQNVLVLSALRVAAMLLCAGGTFVSKVFRSQDYAALLFVLQTLFTRVHATKPLASRNVSAEIFVVCQGYKKPAVLDSRMFDPKCVFLTEGADEGPVHSEDEAAGAAVEKRAQKRQTSVREGDPEGAAKLKQEAGGYGTSAATAKLNALSSLSNSGGGGIFGRGKKGLFAELVRQQVKRHRNGEQMKGLRKVTVEEFFKSEEPASLLVLQAGELIFQTPPTAMEEAVKAHTLTTGEILRCLADVQVLGKGELAMVLKWRFRVRKALLIRQKADLALEDGMYETQRQQSVHQPTEPHHEKSDEVRGLKVLERQRTAEDASTEEGTPSDDDAQEEEEDDVEGELERVGSLVQRREDKRKKRLEHKKKQKELRLRLSRGSCLDAGESLGHHLDPGLFAYSAKIASLLEEASLANEDDLFQSADEKPRGQQQSKEVGIWVEDEDSREGSVRGSDAEEDLSDADACEASSDDMDRVSRLERELMLRHRAQKLKKAQAEVPGKKDAKKKTRREKVRSEWATELESFRDSMQAEAAAVLAEKARQGAESDGSEVEDEESRRERSSRGKLVSEVLDDNYDTNVCGSRTTELNGEHNSFSRGVAASSFQAAEERRSRKPSGKAISEGRSSDWVEAERTARWFRQPLFDGCEDDTLAAASKKLRKATAVSADLEQHDDGMHEKALSCSGGHSDLVFRPKKKRRQSQKSEDFDLRGKAEAGGDFDVPTEVAECAYGSAAGGGLLAGQDEGEDLMVELPEDALPLIPVCEKRQKQQRRREQAQKEQEKASKQMKKMNAADNIDGGELREPSTARGSKKSRGHRLEEVPAFNAVSPGAIKAPCNPEELAQIQTLGNLLINKTSRMDLIDGAYNRYAFNDEELPKWFEEEENKHNKPQLPLTKELMRQYRQKLLDISRRPIRKVQEARARRQLRERRRLQKMKSQAIAIAESAEFTEAGKARALEKIASKASRVKEKSEKNYYVVSRGVRGGGMLVSKKKTGGNKGAKAKFVDRRMKKDKRAQKKAVNRKGGRGFKKRGGKHGRRGGEKAGARGG